MIETGFESRVKVQQIIENQLPEFILDESPKASEFLKQYYISQEYQGGSVDIVENLDQYLKLDNLTPETIVGFTTLSAGISSSSNTIQVNSTKGFPQNYGLLKIDNEIITYTGLTTNTFTGCIRGFCGITSYHSELNYEELVFSESSSSSHVGLSTVHNLSSLFLKEFYKKVKYSLTPGLENKEFVADLNVGNFIKESRVLYQTKGTDESFRILFNVLFGETPKIIDLEQFLSKPSSSTYIRRDVVVADVISGDPVKLAGQTITKSTDEKTTASVSEVEVITRKGKTYYKILLFVGYDDSFPVITGNFNITGSTKNLDYIGVGNSVITVDSTIGFPQEGILYCGENVITYTDKSINQFFGCSNITSGISTASIIYSGDTYYGYEDGDLSKKVEIRVTGVLSNYENISGDSKISVGDEISVKNLGEKIINPIINPSYKEIFANSWIYNTSSRYQIIDTFSSGTTSQLILKGAIDKSSLKVNDYIDIVFRNSQTIIQNGSNLKVISINGNQITTDQSFNLLSGSNYDIRRKIKYAKSSIVPFDTQPIVADVQNVYNEIDEYFYVASNSLPSYQINNSLFSYNANNVSGINSTTGLYSIVGFSTLVSFKTGDEIYYQPTTLPISGLSEGVYYVQVLSGNNQIRLFSSRSSMPSSNYLSFGDLTPGYHNFTLYSQKEKVLSGQKILRKFPTNLNSGDGQSDLTSPGSVGMMVNGVEIFGYKSNDQIYYGPLESVNVLNSGTGYDVINPPLLSISSGNALIQPVLEGSVEKIYVDPQDFDIDVLVSVAITGGNGKGATFEPIIERKRRELDFDARLLANGGGVDNINETITFPIPHGLINGQPITYRSSGSNPYLGIGPFKGSDLDSGNTLIPESVYYTKFISDRTIQLYPSISDYNSGINTIGFTTVGSSGIQKFVTEPKNSLTEIKVINEGSGYTNRKLIVKNTGISTTLNTITFNKHGFADGDLIVYSNTGIGTTTSISLSGLSTSKQYYVIKKDENVFGLADAGIGGTNPVDYLRKKYVSLGSTIGSGYHIFSYPDIKLNVQYTAVGLGSTQYQGQILATPIINGSIIDAYVYANGTGYGSTIINYHQKPTITIKNGKSSELKPIIIDGKIIDVSVLYGGSEYYSTPNIKVIGVGTGAILKPVITNNKISDIVVIRSGVGYASTNTTIIAESAGKNAIFDATVRKLILNNNYRYDSISDDKLAANELIISSHNKLQYASCGYSAIFQTEFGDTGTSHSPIIGWAYDGNPIYGSYGYSDPSNKNSSIKRLVSGYSASLNNVSDRPSGFSIGFFIDDYSFTNSGDLDQYNGRFCVTPEFPNGIYAYFATSIIDSNGNNVGSFPYFIGNRYRSKFLLENKTLDQSFDFNNSNLIRNTFPYKINDKYADNDFLVESNELINQKVIVESVTSGSVEDLEIIYPGTNYQVEDLLKFDDSDTEGGGLIVKVSEVEGTSITNLQANTLFYDDATFIWNNNGSIDVKILPNHSLNNLDYVSVSGFSTYLSLLNGFYQIGVTSYTTTLINNMPSAPYIAGVVTDIYVSNIPQNISIGSSIRIENETLSILDIFKERNIIRVSRELAGSAHTSTTAVNFIPDTFTFKKKVDYFDSKANNLVYFNPNQSVGLGTTSGSSTNVIFNIGIQTNNSISIPTQSIYLPNHPFTTNQKLILTKTSSSASLTVSETSGGSTFNLPSIGNTQTVYAIRKSVDYIGLVTQIGLTTSTNGLFFIGNGSNNYGYTLKSDYNQLNGDIEKNIVTVSVSTSHNLRQGDVVDLIVKPNLSVGGILTTYGLSVLRDRNTGYILLNQLGFSSTGINTTTGTINIPSHNLQTGDKVKYSANIVASGLATGFYFVYKVDKNNIKLSETYIDCVNTNPPKTVSIASTGGLSHAINLVNPKLSSIKNNNVQFDLSNASLFGYKLKIFYDQEFKDEFVSTGSTSTFSVIGIGTPGLFGASLTINYSDEIPNKLFYALEKSGYISTADKEVSNYSQINFVDSYYNGSYKVSGVGSTTFNLALKISPEKYSYVQSECNTLKYNTSSKFGYGSISKVEIVSPGFRYKKLPVFLDVISDSGSGAYIIPKSTTIGKVNQTRIINEGFEYSSDNTLKPEALIPSSLDIINNQEISSINVLDGGKNYTSAPKLIVIDTDTGEKIDSGLLISDYYANSIRAVNISESPKGLPSTMVTIKAIDNTNGVAIKNIQYSSSGIITCTLLTPLAGFSIEPFDIGDKIFVEGIQKYGLTGDGFNSEDYGYQFFTVSGYLNAGTSLNRILTFDLSNLTTNPGIAQTSTSLYGFIVNYKNYPKFEVLQKSSDFILGEILEVKTDYGFLEQDLKVVSYSQNSIKVFGEYELEKNQVIRGSQSRSLFTINEIHKSNGKFDIKYSSRQRIGWSDQTGKLNEDTQVIPDNDYYQNLSYSVKSKQTWQDIVSPVNSILHTSGLKNFSDTEIISNVGVGSTSTEDVTLVLYDIINENRVDTINNFDATLDIDIDTQKSTSRFLKFETKKLTDYIQLNTNRVLKIDDISSQFSNIDQTINPSTNVLQITPSQKYNRYLIQITNNDASIAQLTELVILNDNDLQEPNLYNVEIGSLSTGVSSVTGHESNLLGDFYGEIDPFGNHYLKFNPKSAYTSSYNIKYLNTNFTNSTIGIGTTSIGFTNLTGFTSSVSAGSSVSLLSSNQSLVKSVFSEVHIIDNITNEMNYVELFLDNTNGVDTNLSEYYFDTEDGLSSNYIGTFIAGLSNGVLSLTYSNTSTNSITIKSRNIGFGTTSIGIGTYRFKTLGQPNGDERTVTYGSSFSRVSSASTILSFNKDLFTSLKSTIKVSLGQTSALHQVLMICDKTNTYTTQYPFLSIGSTSGIGTFGGELSGSTASLIFYPDTSLSGSNTYEILCFNQNFYTTIDGDNIPEQLIYGNVSESIGVSKYYSINDDSLNKLDFDLKYNTIPIFTKTFNPADTSVLNTSTGKFSIQNHFFSTGEELIYTPNSTFISISPSAVGIGSTLNSVGVVTNILPTTVYAIKDDNDTFRIATRKEYAQAGISVTFTSVGLGNAHQFEMVTKNEKCIISIDNVIQSPIAYSLLDYSVNNGGQIGTASTIFGISGISSILLNDILKIDNEYMKVINVGLGTTYSGPITFNGSIPLVNVARGFVGSSVTTHSNYTGISLYRGSYNISKNKIYFTQPPIGKLNTQLSGNLTNLEDARSYFNGRVFLKKDYSSNKIYDNISEKFTGIGQTYSLTINGISTSGIGTIGSKGIVILNGIFQTPTTKNNPNNNYNIIDGTLDGLYSNPFDPYYIVPDEHSGFVAGLATNPTYSSISGISSIVFSGITSSNGSVIISQYDINTNQLPRGGIIVSLGSTPGLGYAPLVGASVTAIIGAGGSITSIGIGTTGTWGSGYTGPVSIGISQSGFSGVAATITASVGAGGTLSFNIIGGGSGYSKPTILVSPPSYSNLPITGVSRLGIGTTTDCGVGLLLNVEVGASSTTGIGSTLFEVTNFKVVRNGYAFKKGDVIKAVGLVTAYGLSQPLSEFNLTILDTFTDSFSAWEFGEMDYIDSIKNLQDGIRTRFPLYYNAQLLSFEIGSSPESQVIDPDALLIIFINGILQKPGVSYSFAGGSSFEFTEAPKTEDNVAIFFYRGSSADSSSYNITETIKKGDLVQVFQNNDRLGITTTQNTRTVTDILFSDKIQTDLYTNNGIDVINEKPVYWTKQKTDQIIDGSIISKSRDSIEPQIYPTARIIRDLSLTDNQLFVDDSTFFNYENIDVNQLNFSGLIVSGKSDPVSAALTSVVSASGRITSLSITNAGSGYTGSSIQIKIAAPSKIGIGIGTTATATVTITNGSLTTPITITNSGFGYTSTNPPRVIVPLPDPTYETITKISSIEGFSGKLVGIGTTVGIGTNLALKFTLDPNLAPYPNLIAGYPIYIFDTKIGRGVTSIYDKNSSIVGVGTTFLDNIYNVSSFDSTTGTLICNILSTTSTTGLSTSGSIVGKFSWGKLSGFSRASSPISIGVSAYTTSGLSTFPTIQRRSYGLRSIGAIKKTF